VSNPSVILFSDGPAARVLLQKTESVLAEFPGIRVRNVNKSAAEVSNAVWRRSGPPCIGIYATSRPGRIAGLLAQMEPNPLIVVPVAKKAADGLRHLQAAAAAGAATVALGEAGARNAALLAVAMFAANGAENLRVLLNDFRARQTATVVKTRLPPV
jgi:hypothetical protein